MLFHWLNELSVGLNGTVWTYFCSDFILPIKLFLSNQPPCASSLPVYRIDRCRQAQLLKAGREQGGQRGGPRFLEKISARV